MLGQLNEHRLQHNLLGVSGIGANNIIVGSAGDFPATATGLQAAIDSITDASSTNLYAILVGAGEYDFTGSNDLTCKSYVSVVAVGRSVNLYSKDNSVYVASSMEFSGFNIFHSHTATGGIDTGAILGVSGTKYNTVITRCYIEVAQDSSVGTGFAIRFQNNFVSLRVDNVIIKTGGGGVSMEAASYSRFTDVDIRLVENGTGVPEGHYGYRQTGGARTEVIGGTTKVGYDYPNINDNIDTFGFYIPVGASTGNNRIEIYGHYCLIRNDGSPAKSSCIQAEESYIRAYGSRFQLEAGTQGPVVSYYGTGSEPASGLGIAELIGCRVTPRLEAAAGNVRMQGGSIGTHHHSANKSINTHDYGLHIVDTSGGAVTLTLPTGLGNHDYSFINTGGNNLIITPSGGMTINGAATLTLTQWQRARLTYDNVSGNILDF